MSWLEQFSMVFSILGVTGFVVAIAGMSVVDELRPQWSRPVAISGMVIMFCGFAVSLAGALTAAIAGA